VLEREGHALANRSGLALIARGLQHGHSIFIPAAQLLKPFYGVVAASVINEDESDSRFAEELLKLNDRQSKGLIVARYNDHNLRHEVGLSQAAMITDPSFGAG
jgi:hypothetical protein